jgi:hypothetical protein
MSTNDDLLGTSDLMAGRWRRANSGRDSPLAARKEELCS